MMAEKFSEFSVINIWCTSVRVRERRGSVSPEYFNISGSLNKSSRDLRSAATGLETLETGHQVLSRLPWPDLASGLVWPGWVCQFIFSGFAEIFWTRDSGPPPQYVELSQRLYTSGIISDTTWSRVDILHSNPYLSLEAYSSLP